ncbi:UDP-glucose dehydrogenase family protein [Chloroflexota bacterium]
MANICVIGVGHVGLVAGACFAELGNNVICADDDTRKIDGLKKYVLPFYEPGLEAMVQQNAAKGRLSFVYRLEDGVISSEIIFIAVGTPQKTNGAADLTSIENVTRRIAAAADGYKLIVEKSTVPIRTWEWINKTIIASCRQGLNYEIACNPEFMREGSAIEDFMKPDRIVLGVNSERAAKQLTDLYQPICAPLVITDVSTAELIKHASNSFLAMKISYINAVATICEKTGADVMKVAEGMGLDKRIGKGFLNAGIGYGGYCFPKDVAAFIKMADENGYDFELLKAVQVINNSQRKQILRKAKEALWNLKGKAIGILGLSYKPDTDDMREAPSVYIIGELLKRGVSIKAYDPQAMETAKNLLPGIDYCRGPYEAARGCDALLILTEWEEFKNLDLSRIKNLLKQPIIIDGRNIFDPMDMKALGFIYSGIGR